MENSNTTFQESPSQVEQISPAFSVPGSLQAIIHPEINITTINAVSLIHIIGGKAVDND